MSIFKRKSFWITLVIIAVIIIVIIAVSSKGEEEEKYNTIIVERQDLLQTVSETGQVVSDPDIQLGFQTNGIIDRIFYKIGDKVKEGDVITALEGDDQSASIASARAALQAAQAALDLKLAGATQEEIDISKANVEMAKVALETAQSNFDTVLSNAELNIKNAEIALEKAKINMDLLEQENQKAISLKIENAYDDMYINIGASLTTLFNGLQAADAVIGFEEKNINDDFEEHLSVTNPQALNDANKKCREAMMYYDIANDHYINLTINSEHSQINDSISHTDTAFETVDQCLYLTRLVLEHTSTSFDFQKSELNALITEVDNSKANIKSVLSSYETYKQALNSAKNSFAIAENDYQSALQNLEAVRTESRNQIRAAGLEIKAKESALAASEAELAQKKSDPRDVDLAGLYAEINRAQANLDAAQYAFRKTQIIAPVEGIISKIEYDKGENIAAFTKMISMITPMPKIQVNVPESDIAKVKLNDPVKITLDAFEQDTVFKGKVTFIEPAETEISGVTYYKVDIVFTDTLEKDIKPGMTADVIITTDKREKVISVPHRAILVKDGKKIVRILENGEIKEVKVKTGLRGDSNTEILFGLKKGDEVITFIQSAEENQGGLF